MTEKTHIIRNFIFGAEDALVSSVGALFGLAASNLYSHEQIINAGLVVISVEALSMGVGSFLTEESVNEVEDIEHETTEKKHTILGGIIMFLSYFLAGMAVLSPYIFMSIGSAKFVSVIITLLMLFVLGFLPTKNTKSGLRMLFVAGLAILTGFFVAQLTNTNI